MLNRSALFLAVVCFAAGSVEEGSEVGKIAAEGVCTSCAPPLSAEDVGLLQLATRGRQEQVDSTTCTASGSDPYASGHEVDCCSGLQSCLGDWRGTGVKSYLCYDTCPGSPASACTASGSDPYASGHKVDCCEGLQSCLGVWGGAGVKSYLCYATCSGSPAPTPAPVPVGDQLSVPVFWWNVHWQCSVGAQGSSGSCKDEAAQRFVQLAHEADAQIVASIELSNGMSQPVDLVDRGLEGWTQVDGPCAKGGGGDSSALAFAPGWVVEKSGGGCLRNDDDTRAFAVARVAPPSPVRGCSSLCVVAVHAPHTSINSGKDTVSSVCGGAVDSCAIAMGDWNVPADGVGQLWAELIGGSAPGLVFPNERTCCYPESENYGVFDHIATNIPGAGQAGYDVYPYQLTELNPEEEHRPVAATLALPMAE